MASYSRGTIYAYNYLNKKDDICYRKINAVLVLSVVIVVVVIIKSNLIFFIRQFTCYYLIHLFIHNTFFYTYFLMTNITSFILWCLSKCWYMYWTKECFYFIHIFYIIFHLHGMFYPFSVFNYIMYPHMHFSLFLLFNFVFYFFFFVFMLLILLILCKIYFEKRFLFLVFFDVEKKRIRINLKRISFLVYEDYYKKKKIMIGQ